MEWMLPHGNMGSSHHDYTQGGFDSAEENSKTKGRRRKKLLYKTVRDQMEFYFSDANLSKDRYLRQLVEDDPYVPLEIFLKFNKINRLVTTVEEIAKALRKSEILQLSDDSLKVHRTLPVKARENEEDCTIYVENLPPEITHDELTQVFSGFGKVVYVSIPKYRTTHLIKGFAFVEFETPKDAAETIRIFKEKGSCLSPHMLPDKLCSIRTFDHQGGTESHKPVIENEEDSKSKTIMNEKVDPSLSNDEHNKLDKHEESSLNTSNSKKRKLDCDGAISNDVENARKKEKSSNMSCDKEEISKENNSIDSNCSEDDENIQEAKLGLENEAGDVKLEVNQEASLKKKKKRKKRKHSKEEELFAKGMVVLFKKEWKRLRNKYLNMQRVNMRRVKQQVLEARFMRRPHFPSVGWEHGRDEEMRPPPPPVDAPKPRVTFVPGVIVCVKFNEPAVDIKAFKAEAKAQPGVQYVDVQEGAVDAYLRCSTPQDANHLLQIKFWKNVSVLSGNDESEYWEKIFKDREAKLGNKVRVGKERGRKKLLRKAETVKATHLHFDS